MRYRFFAQCFGAALLLAPSCRAPGASEKSLTQAAPRGELKVTTLEPEFIRGFCYAHSYNGQGYGTDASRESLKALRELGTKWVSLTPFAFMRSKSQGQIQLISELIEQPESKAYFELSPGASPETDEVVRAEVKAAQALGFKVQLKPHIWMLDGSWRGEIELSSQSEGKRFWTHYRTFILHYADLAQQTGAEMLVIGVELDQTVSAHDKAWRRIIAEVRERYSGALTYGSNWDAYDRVQFWDELDYVGVQFYPPLADDAETPPAVMAQRLAKALDSLELVGQRFDKTVLLTEVGFRAVTGTAVRPHEWPDPNSKAADVEAQSQAYRVLMNGLVGRKRIGGIFLWKWYTEPVGDEGIASFSPRGRPAADVVRTAFGGRL